MANDSERLDVAAQLRTFLRVVREQKWLVIVAVLAATGAAYAYASHQRKEYRTEAKILFQQDNLGSLLNGQGPGIIDPIRQSATDTQLSSLPVVAARVIKRLKPPRLPDGVSAGVAGEANLISIAVSDRDPALAARFANAYAKEYIAFRRQANQRRYSQALAIVQSQVNQLSRHNKHSPQLPRLRDEAHQLQLISSVQTGDAQLVQTAGVPTVPYTPHKLRTTLTGLLAGLVLGLGLAFLRDRLDRRVKREEDVKEAFPDVPVVGIVPRPARGKVAQAVMAESFHNVEASLRVLSPNGAARSVLITSASPREGKSTVTANLALAMSKHGRNALVVEADMRKPGLSERLGLPRDVGVSRILVGDATVGDSMRRATVHPSRNGKGPTVAIDGDLTLVPAGPTPPNPQILLTEQRLEALLSETRIRAETVVFDGPPMGLFSDMLPLARRVDAVLVIVRLYHSRRDHLKRFAEQLADAGIHPIGVVLLGARSSVRDYYGYYS